MPEVTLRFVQHAGLFHRPGFFNRLCQLAQCGFPYTHVDAVAPDGRYLGARLLGGVRFRDPGEDAGTILLEKFVSLRATALQASLFYAFLRDQIGKPYDPIAILYFWGPFASRNWHDPSAWECSSLIAEAFIACGMMRENDEVPSWRVTPSHLWWFTKSIAAGEADA